MDCGWTHGRHWFRYRAAAIIIEEECVLFAQNDIDDYYYSIGGGVHLSEKSDNAIKREVLEETGIDFDIDRLAFVHENFFTGTGSLLGIKRESSVIHCRDESIATYERMLPSFCLYGTLYV